MRKVKDSPCNYGKHEFYDSFHETINCSTEYCFGSVAHCKKCGWYISECGCGFHDGADTVSPKQRKYIDKVKEDDCDE